MGGQELDDGRGAPTWGGGKALEHDAPIKDQGYQPFWAPPPTLTKRQEEIFGRAKDYHNDGHIVEHAVGIKGRKLAYDKKAMDDARDKHAMRETWKQEDRKKKNLYGQYLLDREARYRFIPKIDQKATRRP